MRVKIKEVLRIKWMPACWIDRFRRCSSRGIWHDWVCFHERSL